MQTKSLVGLMCLCVFGCASGPRWFDDFSGDTSVSSSQIVIIASATTSGERATTSKYRWVLEKAGKGHGVLYFGNQDESDGTITEYEFPAGIYDECLAKIEETRFFQLKSAPPGKLDGSSSFIEIHHRGRKHIAKEIGANAKSDDELNKFWLFLGDVLKRGTVVETRTVRNEKKQPGPRRIEISNGSSPGIPGPFNRTEWVLEKGGPCRGKTINGFLNISNNVVEYELPAEVFDECQALLESTAFFRMTVQQPDFTFEPSHDWIRVRRDGITHAVGVTSPTPHPEGFVRLQAFLAELPKRGKAISTTTP